MIPVLLILGFLDQSVEMRTTFTYDNNLYRYSAVDLDTFLAGAEPERFPIESADDLITAFSLNYWLRARIFKPRTTTIRFQAATANHAVNHPKDYQTFGVILRQSLVSWALMANYQYQPRFLIRYYPAPGSKNYLACNYSFHHAGLSLSRKISRVFSVQLAVKREYEIYRQEFSPYNSRTWRFNSSLNAVTRPFLESMVMYDFKISQADGPIPDISHHQHQATIMITVPLPLIKTASLEAEYRLAYRWFKTDLSPDQDTPHAGRVDITHRWQTKILIPLYQHCSLIPAFSYELRRSRSDVYPEIGDKKNYDVFQISSGLRFYY